MDNYSHDAFAVLLKTILSIDYHIETKEVKKQMKSGVIYVPKKFIGNEVILLIRK